MFAAFNKRINVASTEKVYPGRGAQEHRIQKKQLQRIKPSIFFHGGIPLTGRSGNNPHLQSSVE